MEHEHDYKTACEVLLKAVQEADRILRKANLRIYLQTEREAGRLSYENVDEEDPA